MIEDYVIITFHTTAEAMATEKLCKAKKIEGRLFSAPREYTVDCGIAWKSPANKKQMLLDELNSSGIEYAGIH